MNIVFSASRLMKVSEVRRVCEEMRKNPALLLATELSAKEQVYNLLQQEKTASAATLAI